MEGDTDVWREGGGGGREPCREEGRDEARRSKRKIDTELEKRRETARNRPK